VRLKDFCLSDNLSPLSFPLAATYTALPKTAPVHKEKTFVDTFVSSIKEFTGHLVTVSYSLSSLPLSPPASSPTPSEQKSLPLDFKGTAVLDVVA